MLILPHLKFSLSFVTDLLSVLPFVTGVTEYLKAISLALHLWYFGNTVEIREKIGIATILSHVTNVPSDN
jgi:hypothetical protein